ncbi:concanavalin A-like lectin/glucanase domain-containing protein [Radiomyces spectabilis]|uniref:concanavalin A-like lectin/glucanase domain-containing protein n=1 Tax=Radiomyces spectabilis TaxID=64574 RepID=UPI002220F222|nr:concanavalin A-like lectin/glucanase domain-containing protein [Radiomyces spectabilis]KAI8372863.1 concanavalin A-like lectin/glucanase domain-containing protein [Radiomyces spectabilis]
MRSLNYIAILLILATLEVVQGWTLQDDYSPGNFFDKFNFFDAPDPTKGFVQYLNYRDARSKHLLMEDDDHILIRAENRTVTPEGRPSVRLRSKEQYNSGLFLLDLRHMPTGCGTWPAFWLIGPKLPDSGEIDILEGVNHDTYNAMTLHTGPECTMENVARTMSGKPHGLNCDMTARDALGNKGCSVFSKDSKSFGAGFNGAQGGVIALRWTDDTGIQSWFFERDAIPKDILAGEPQPDDWPTPMADYPFTECSPRHFRDMAITINLTFCGNWAGSTYAASGCPSNCVDFVRDHPEAFDEAYWDINYLRVYQE